jgi:isopentenyldiphosphate isomerase
MITDPQEELLTQVDQKNNVIGGIKRGVAHSSKNTYYRTIFVLVKNERDEILIQKRSPTKDLYPNCWDLSVGGHVIYGDTYEETALRELEEELGIKADLMDLVEKGEVLVLLPSSNEYFHVFEYKLKKTDSIKLAIEEVVETRWLGLKDLKQSMIDKNSNWYPRPLQIVKAIY